MAAKSAKLVKARFKFKHSIPLHLEYALLNRYGFVYFARSRNNWTMYEKYTGSDRPKVIKYDDLSEEIVNELTRRVNRVAGCFEHPDEHKDLIKIRCTNMARTLEPKQRAWVLNWIRRNVDEDDGDNLPWENGPANTGVKEH